MAPFPLIRPIIQSGLNRVRFSESRAQVLFRDGVLVALAIGLGWATYRGTHFMLERLQEIFTLAYVPPTLPLALILLVLFIMLIVSNVVSAVGLFYLSDDLSLILASPVPPSRVFFDRLLVCLLSTSAISLIFLLPVLVGYIMYLKVSWQFVFVGAAALIPYFIIPTALSFFIATALSLFVPLRRSRLLLGVLIGGLLSVIVSVVELIRLVTQVQGQDSNLAHLIQIFSIARYGFLPSAWVYDIFTVLTGFSDVEPRYRLVLLYSTALVLCSSGFLLFRAVHLRAYTALASQKTGAVYRVSKVAHFIRTRMSGGARQLCSLALKDITLLSRDMSQLFQGILLFGIYLIYVYNLRVYVSIHALGMMDFWWKNFLFISNFCVSAFIVSALCTRFVFPSISLEGRCFPVLLASAPISVRGIVMGKFWFWYVVVCCIHIIVSGGAAAVSAANWQTILVILSTSPIICYGLVGLAMGFGSYFHRFDWESSSQLAVGFGNIAFMLTGSALILLSMVPLWFLVFRIAAVTTALGLAVIVTGVLLLWACNMYIGGKALAVGTRRLEQALT